ncbi:MAG: DUF1732 domain-containing protein, partial [Planctomycetota bacterium]|nr:DUF1732 domain-containing protein [Planctomycetota bacterium]
DAAPFGGEPRPAGRGKGIVLLDPLSKKEEMEGLQRNIALEVSLFAQRSDMNEEIKRLGSHIQEFSNTLNKDGVMGKKLEFIAQEMLREINTIGNKSNDTDITYSVIALKEEVDKIKEQVQNIE